MRVLIALLFAAFSANAIAQNCESIGGQTYCDNGPSTFETQRAEEKRKVDEPIKRQRQDHEAIRIAREDRKRRLKSGEINVANFDDALLYFDPSNPLRGIVGSPMLSPDSNVYVGVVKLDAKQGNNLLRAISQAIVAWDDDVSQYRVRTPMGVDPDENKYVFLKMTQGTVNYVPENMRIGFSIAVIGKYIDNRDYRTVLGVKMTAPLIEVSYIGVPTAKQ